MSAEVQVARHARASRRRKEALDLNVPPQSENLEQVGGPAISLGQGGQSDVSAISVDYSVQVPGAAESIPPTPIDVEDIDDDVIISSPRAFEEAKKKSRRTRRTVVFDVDSGEEEDAIWVNQVNKRRRGQTNFPIINCELYVNLEGSSGSTRARLQYVAPAPAPPPPPPPPPSLEPTFTCPICMGALVEEVTTRCGHIFCKGCLKYAIKTQHKCPTCRRKINNRDMFRVYLPTTK